MQLTDIKDQLVPEVYAILEKEGIVDLRPCQEKAISSGLLEGKSQLICTPTASGKTLVGEMAAMQTLGTKRGISVYIVPLKALASEKFKSFKKKYAQLCNVQLAVGDVDSEDLYLAKADFIICTAEKLDSLTRHHAPWLKKIGCIIVDEIHLLNDPSRGPTLEILLTILKKLVPSAQRVGLSATIGNPKDLADWLDARLVEDDWRPVELKQGVVLDNALEFD